MDNLRYCLYARKSTESDENQTLSIDSQIKEMLEMAKRIGLNVIDIKQEKHSAKEVGQRPIFNEMIQEIREERFDGILTWAPDRIARNAGDLGNVVDLIDNGKLKEIRTYGQLFQNTPNDKFLLMILGSQAKLENDNKSVNVKRGMRAKCEMGWRPGMPPLGYLTNKTGLKGQKQIFLDEYRAPIIKEMFEKVAYERNSGRKIYAWLKKKGVKTRTGKDVALSSIYSMLKNTFYYGKFEYPQDSGHWYEGLHEPIVTKELFDKAQEQIVNENLRYENREFAFTKLMKCGLCGSGITAEEKYKKLKNGTITKYIYYGCTRGRDLNCKGGYIREEELIRQLTKLIDGLNLDETEIKKKFDYEIQKYNKFRYEILKINEQQEKPEEKLDYKKYINYILNHGSIHEKREILSYFKDEFLLVNKKIIKSRG